MPDARNDNGAAQPQRGAAGPAEQAPGRPQPSGGRPGPLGGEAAQPQRGPPVWPYLVLAMVVIGLDQWSKLAVEARFQFAERMTVLPGWFDLTLAYNTGAAFSFLAGAGGWQRWLFSGIAVAAAIFITWLLFRARGERTFSIALGLILGGAIGNLIDRLLAGKVTDFLLVYRGDWYFPAFNLADSALTLGAILMIGDELLRLRKR